MIIEDGSLRIQDVTVNDADIVSYFEEIPAEKRDERLLVSIRVGTQSLRSAETIDNIDYIERRFQRLHNSIDGHIESYFADDGKLASEIFDPHTDGSPLYALRRAIEEEFEDLYHRLGIEEGVEKVQKRTTEKGGIFQEKLGEKLSDIVSDTNDRLKETGEEIGDIEGRKVGDFVIELANYPARIVIEAKNESGQSLPSIEREMEEARSNRNADYSIFFARHYGQIPDKIGWFKEYTGNLLVVAVAEDAADDIDENIVKIAYRWARMKAIQQHVSFGEELAPGRIQTQVDAAKRTASKFSEIKGDCTSIRKARRSIEGQVKEMESDLESALLEIEKELTDAAE